MCSQTPRFSYSVLKLGVRHRVLHRQLSARRGSTGPGWVLRTGIRVGWAGVYPPVQRAKDVPCKAEQIPAKRAPEALREGWSGWVSVQRPRTSAPTPAGPAPDPWSSAGAPRANPASWPIRARFDLHFTKLSQNRVVSPKYVHKASLSPCFQNGSQKSPLDISRIPFSVAFSHKELMAHFGAYSDFYVKMTKCRPDVHTMSREVVGHGDGPDTPLATLLPIPHLDLRM